MKANRIWPSLIRAKIPPARLKILFTSLALLVFASQAAGTTKDQVRTRVIFPGVTIRNESRMSMAVDREKRSSTKGKVIYTRVVRLSATTFNGTQTSYWASFDRIQTRHGILNVKTYANKLRKLHKQLGYRNITVRARPNQKAIEKIYYKPASREWITSKTLVLNKSTLLQGFHTASPSERNAAGSRAMRRVVLSLAPSR